MRYVAPWLLRYFVRKSAMNYQQSQQNKPKTGEVHINSQNKHKGNKSSLGEYVEYEEITEEKSNTSKS